MLESDSGLLIHAQQFLYDRRVTPTYRSPQAEAKEHVQAWISTSLATLLLIESNTRSILLRPHFASVRRRALAPGPRRRRGPWQDDRTIFKISAARDLGERSDLCRWTRQRNDEAIPRASPSDVARTEV